MNKGYNFSPIDKKEVLERIKIAFKGLTQKEMANICGISQPAINKYFKKGLMPSIDVLTRISEYSKSSIDWLLTGKGPKELSAIREAPIPYEPSPNIIITNNPGYRKIIEQQPNSEAYIPIPLISNPVAAGDPLIIEEKDIEGFAVIYRAWVKRGHTYRCLRVKGNSMHPVISDGFIVAIDLTENDPLKLPRHIVAARHEDGVTIKYLLLTEKEYILLPYNTTDYDPIIILRTAPSPIIGKVAWWWGKAK